MRLKNILKVNHYTSIKVLHIPLCVVNVLNSPKPLRLGTIEKKYVIYISIGSPQCVGFRQDLRKQNFSVNVSQNKQTNTSRSKRGKCKGGRYE